MPFRLFCLVQLERAKAHAREAYQHGLRWRLAQEEQHRRALRFDAALRACKASW